jgi:hypothetical protein
MVIKFTEDKEGDKKEKEITPLDIDDIDLIKAYVLENSI